MIHKKLFVIKAAPALMAGIAFFLCSCAQKPTVAPQKAVTAPAPVNFFDKAEEYFANGELQPALQSYEIFLARNPDDPRAPKCLHRIGEIYLKLGRPEEALNVLRTVQQKYPQYRDMPSVEYLSVLSLYKLDNYEDSIRLALAWVQKYPGHMLRGRLFLLLGRSYAALSDNPEALKWFMEAYRSYGEEDVEDISELETSITEVIEQGNSEDLKKMAVLAKGTKFAPEIFHKLAFLCLQKNDLEGAKQAALALIMSTHEQYWVSLGKEILDRVNKELSVESDKIGCLLPLSGPFHIFGEEVLKGLELGMGLFSESGDGPGIQLILRDTEGQPELAEVGLEELANEEKVIGIIGPLRSKSAQVAATLAEQLGVPLITLSQKDGIPETGEMIFRNFISPSKEVERLVTAAIQDLKIRRFAIFYPDNAYGKYFMKLFWDKVEELGGEIRGVEKYSIDQTDFAQQIKKIVGLYYPRPDYVVENLRLERTPEEEEEELSPGEKDPIIDFEAVFIPDYYKRVAMIAPQLIYHDVLDVWVMGTSQWQSDELIELSGPYLQGAIFTSGFFSGSPDPVVQNFVSRFQTVFNTEPGILAASGYDTIRFLKELLETREIRTRRELQMAITEFPGIDGVTGHISFNVTGEVEKQPFLLTIMGRRMLLFH